MIDDDDLPVLTQILRTGRSGAHALPAAMPEAMTAIDGRPVDRTLVADQLVIGTDPAAAPRRLPRAAVRRRRGRARPRALCDR